MIYDEFKQKAAKLNCNEVIEKLVTLGFHVRKTKRAGHYLLKHNGLPLFDSKGFNCGHGRNPVLKKTYVLNLAKLLEEQKDDILTYLFER